MNFNSMFDETVHYIHNYFWPNREIIEKVDTQNQMDLISYVAISSLNDSIIIDSVISITVRHSMTMWPILL